jgi:hypothetical protein
VTIDLGGGEAGKFDSIQNRAPILTLQSLAAQVPDADMAD